MSFRKMLKNCCLALPLLFILAACGGPSQTTQREPAGVQDINPGDKSIIQPPAARPENASQVKERNI